MYFLEFKENDHCLWQCALPRALKVTKGLILAALEKDMPQANWNKTLIKKAIAKGLPTGGAMLGMWRSREHTIAWKAGHRRILRTVKVSKKYMRVAGEE